ncbi:unnamed protein product [Urochloa decumbens]|uniref:WRKY domain-containing protein n=1 Tax=Urochloa decumbens TaxID=240449 RepID=A0ABC9AMQ8_9POAL
MNVLESSIHGDSQVVINEIEHQKALLMELHDIILPILYSHNDRKQLVQQLFQDMFSSSSKSISCLQLRCNNDNKEVNLIRDQRNGGKHHMKNCILEKEAKNNGNNRRKTAQLIGSLVTHEPHYDGYQWRKYGEKRISKAKHSRSYYRCANIKAQGCRATKVVQEQESDRSGMVRLFDVGYYGQHICKKDDISNTHGFETSHEAIPRIGHNNQRSSSTLVHDIHGIEDNSFQNMVMVHDEVEYLMKDIEMGRALDHDVTINLQDFELWEFSEQQNPLNIWT